MINSSLPSRAEISDLHSLLHKGISGIVLAAEVAIGKIQLTVYMLFVICRKCVVMKH